MCNFTSSLRQIAEKCDVSHTIVARIRKRYVSRLISSQNGRPRLISDRAAREIAHFFRSDNYKTPKIAAHEIEISASEWTIRRSLRRIGLRAKEEESEPALSNKNIKLRKQFVDTYEEWMTKDWKRVIWSDETKINRFKFDARSWYWTSSENNDQPGGIKQTMKFGGGSIMCWGCFTRRGVGPLVRIEGIMRKERYLTILHSNLPSVVNSIGYNKRKVVFQQDEHPKYTAKIVKTWLENQNFSVMKWPAQGPDMNPIENLLSILKRRMAKYNNPSSGVYELWERTQLEWYNI